MRGRLTPNRSLDVVEIAVPVSWVRESTRSGAMPCVQLSRYRRMSQADRLRTDTLPQTGVLRGIRSVLPTIVADPCRTGLSLTRHAARSAPLSNTSGSDGRALPLGSV